MVLANIRADDVVLQPNAFLDLTALTKLDLDGSPGLIARLLRSDVILDSISGVQHLSIHNSELVSLHQNWTQHFRQLTALHVSSSRWHCDVTMIWFRDWLRRTFIQMDDHHGTDRNRCQSPRSVHDRPIISLDTSDFVSIYDVGTFGFTTAIRRTSVPTTIAAGPVRPKDFLSTKPLPIPTPGLQSAVPQPGANNRASVLSSEMTTVPVEVQMHEYDDDSEEDDEIMQKVAEFPSWDDGDENLDKTPEMGYEDSIRPIDEIKTPSVQFDAGETTIAITDDKFRRRMIPTSNELNSPSSLTTTRTMILISGNSERLAPTGVGTTVIVTVTVTVTALLAAIIVGFIVHLSRKQVKSVKTSPLMFESPRSGRREVAYFMSSLAEIDDCSAVVRTTAVSVDERNEMTLICGPNGRDGPTPRVYTWDEL